MALLSKVAVIAADILFQQYWHCQKEALKYRI